MRYCLDRAVLLGCLLVIILIGKINVGRPTLDTHGKMSWPGL